MENKVINIKSYQSKKKISPIKISTKFNDDELNALLEELLEEEVLKIEEEEES